VSRHNGVTGKKARAQFPFTKKGGKTTSNQKKQQKQAGRRRSDKAMTS